MNLLFDYHINYYSDSKNRTDLPFSIFALTQQGLEHQKLNVGNQDAGTLYLGKNILIGSVADGCTSGNNLNGKSNNQTGAVIGSYLIVRLLRKLVLKKHIPLSEILPPLEHNLMTSLRKFVNALNPWEFERRGLIKNFFLSTLLFFVITEDEYLIANCGDGDILINGSYNSLNLDSGNYFANNLIEMQKLENGDYSIKPSLNFRIVSQGRTNDLHNLFIATDGFLDEDVLKHHAFQEFFLNRTDDGRGNGFQERRSEFRRDFLSSTLEMKNGRIWPQDDATFISIQRIEKQNL